METNQIPSPPQANIPMPPPAPSFNSAPPPPPGQVNLSGNKGMAILAYLGPLILIPFLTEAKNDPFVKFHLKQGLVLIIVAIGWNILTNFIPGFFWMFSMLLSLVSLGFLIIGIIGIINVVNGQMKPLPIIGQFARSFNF